MDKFNLREYLKNNPLLKEDVNIVKGFKEFEVDDEPDTEEDFEVRSFGAPMEGWDDEHYDYINIFSTATSDPDTGEELKPKYYVDVYVSYGDWTKDRTYYNTEEEAYAEVEEIMNDLKEDWDEDLLENNPLLKENKSGPVKYLRDAFMSYLEGGDSFKNAPGKVEKIVWDKEEYGDPQNYNDAGGFMIALKALESSPISIQFPEYGKVSFTKKGNNIVGSFVVPKD